MVEHRQPAAGLKTPAGCHRVDDLSDAALGSDVAPQRSPSACAEKNQDAGRHLYGDGDS